MSLEYEPASSSSLLRSSLELSDTKSVSLKYEPASEPQAGEGVLRRGV